MSSGFSLALLMVAIAMPSAVHSKDSNTGVDPKDAEIARLRVKVERLRADLHSSNDQEDQWTSESGPNAKDKNGPRRNGGKGRFTVGETGKKVEYWRNHPLTGSEDFDRAVIIVHGNSRNADDYFDAVSSTAKSYSNALVLVPKFKTAEDEPKDDEVYWSTAGWSKGFKSQNGTETASFAVIDDMLQSISSRFPRVTEIVIAGHSAGGQFVQRYAGVGKAPETTLLRSDITVRYVVANPSTYMFLDVTRPRPYDDCPTSYDQYKYGMSNLPQSLHYTDLSQDEIRSNLVNREVSLLLGTDDNKRVTPMDLSCEADAQGRHRYIRGMNYRDHINDFAASNSGFNGVRTTVTTVPGVGHDYKGMFTSTEGIELLFAVPSTAEPTAPPTAEPTTAPTGPQFTLGSFKTKCQNNAGLQTSADCFAAVRTLGLTIKKQLTKKNKNFPTGCSVRTKKGVRVAFFNKRFGKAHGKFQPVCKAGR